MDAGRHGVPACEPGHEDALTDGVIRIRPGETLCVSLDATGDSVTPKAIVPAGDPASLLVLRFWQEPGSSQMFLSVHSPLADDLRYKAFMVRSGSLRQEYTSSCPVLSHRFGIENWPFAISELRITGLVALRGARHMECR
ncbi:hypothetical protein ACXU4B_13320 [Dyella soli]|uniref:Uncharacterized protein n=1 Tax=Dyella soli TaxID=522319 RepID=A0A4R0YF70_9GAMM|nr:hypothetical protein [Dyella soli]TCI06886.1 hypothetical protein EZM97_30120 [Dyella soli]